MSLKLAARLVAVEPQKILDLQENDTVAHTEDLSAIIPLGTQAIIISSVRQSGSGIFHAFPKSTSTITVIITSGTGLYTLPIKNRELKWKNSAANDDWDIFLYGYFVQKRSR